jgi:hypothetical protein
MQPATDPADFFRVFESWVNHRETVCGVTLFKLRMPSPVRKLKNEASLHRRAFKVAAE